MNVQHSELLHTAATSLKHLLDGVSVLVVIGTIANALPPIAALLTIIWTAIRIIETRTVQRFLGKRTT